VPSCISAVRFAIEQNPITDDILNRHFSHLADGEGMSEDSAHKAFQTGQHLLGILEFKQTSRSTPNVSESVSTVGATKAVLKVCLNS
jgi:hypothetical protein